MFFLQYVLKYFFVVFTFMLIKKKVFFVVQKIMNIQKEKLGNLKFMLVGMSKKVYKEMVKEMNIIASRKESSQD